MKSAILKISNDHISGTGRSTNFLFYSVGAYCQQRAKHVTYELAHRLLSPVCIHSWNTGAIIMQQFRPSVRSLVTLR